jgi:hypothetical protein
MPIIESNFVCTELSKYISDVTGLKNTSSSPSDTWVVTFKKDTTFDNIPVKKGFLKIFIDMDNLRPKSNSSLALKYEMNIYSSIINDILKYNICPNFVKYLASGEKCSYLNLLNILYPYLHSSDERPLSRKKCIENLNRNLYYVLKDKLGRPAIEDEIIIGLLRPVDFLHSAYTYNIILTENIDNPFTFNKWLFSYGSKPEYKTELWNILFQITVACYTMSLSKLVHNDLHSNNIFIRDLGVETYFLYNINGEKITIKTRYQPLIYDFDRGYVERFGKNIYLDGSLCTKTSQCNIFIKNKDIIKILCYVYKNIDTETKDSLLEIISKNEVYKDKIKDTYDLRSTVNGLRHCFLQYVDEYDNEKAIPVEWYDNFNDNLNILSEIYHEYLPEYSDYIVKKNNTFTCNQDYFNADGTIDIDKVLFGRLSPISSGSPPMSSASPPMSSASSPLDIDELNDISLSVLDTFPMFSDDGGNNKKIDDFIVDFSSKISELKKFEAKNECYTQEHYKIFNSLFQTLSQRKKYAFDIRLWEELYYHSIYFYPKINKIGSIQTVLVTKHNHILPFYMKHNIGKLDTSFLHFDTHPDMNTIKNNIDLPTLNEKLEKKDIEYIDKAQDIVWDIGAAISGVIITTGIQNYVWAMPKWIPDPNLKTTYFIKDNKNTINLYTNDIKMKDDDLVDLTYLNKYKNQDKKEKNYIKIQTGNDSNKKIVSNLVEEFGNTYILDIDLDYFVCNGQKLKRKVYYNDQYDVSSTNRTNTIIINENSPRDFYYESKELIKFQKELTKEIQLINKRINKFLSLIKSLKNKGCTPTHISICDSTNIEFSMCKKCNSLSNGYVPTNLALIVHDKVFKGLKDIFE